jgi:ribonuclease P protein component
MARERGGHPRIGLTVSRQVGAVVRNRWKRLLRGHFGRRRSELSPLDLVCRAGSRRRRLGKCVNR